MESNFWQLKRIIEEIKRSSAGTVSNIEELGKAIDSIRFTYHDNWRTNSLPKIKKFHSQVKNGIPAAVLSVCGKGTREIRFSQYLAYYLENNYLHGLGPKLMYQLADLFNLKQDVGEYTIETEKWLGSVQSKRREKDCYGDIVITGEDYVIFIEQKLLSPEGYDKESDRTQLADYNRAIKSNPEFDKPHIIKIFLTPEGIDPRDVDNWKPITHRQIIHKALNLLKDDTLSGIAKANLSRFIMDLAIGPYKRQEEDINEMFILADKIVNHEYDFASAVRLETMFNQMDMIVELIMEGC